MKLYAIAATAACVIVLGIAVLLVDGTGRSADPPPVRLSAPREALPSAEPARERRGRDGDGRRGRAGPDDDACGPRSTPAPGPRPDDDDDGGSSPRSPAPSDDDDDEPSPPTDGDDDTSSPRSAVPGDDEDHDGDPGDDGD